MTAWLTTEDEQNYGRDLLDVTQRAAMQALSPALQGLANQNEELRQRLAQEAKHRLDQQIERALPDFRERDRDPGWHTWLRGIDSLSGRVRQSLLNEATASGNANRVLAFFRSYQSEASTQLASTQQASTSGRTRSASSGRQTYTRPQIAALYEQHRKGLWAGRESEWARLEADFCAASAEGRIQGPDYLTK